MIDEAECIASHGLLSMPGFSLQTEEGCLAVIDLLDQHLKLLQPLLTIVASNSALVANARGYVDDDATRALIEAMGGNLEIREYDPAQGMPKSGSRTTMLGMEPTERYVSPHSLAIGARKRGRLTCDHFHGVASDFHVVCERF